MGDLVERLEGALNNTGQRQQLLQEQGTLRQIMQDMACRRWFIEQVALAETCDRNLILRSRKVRNLLIQIMQHSGSIQRQGNTDPEVYDEALSRTLEWFSGNLFNHLQAYDPERGGMVTWFNNNLKYKIKDILRDRAIDQQRRQPQFYHPDSTDPDPIEAIPSFDSNDDDTFFKTAIELIQQDPEKRLRRTRMQGTPRITAQYLSLQILQQLHSLGEIQWPDLASQLDVSEHTLKRFWFNTARPQVRSLFRTNDFL
jgi:hypothetical protein